MEEKFNELVEKDMKAKEPVKGTGKSWFAEQRRSEKQERMDREESHEKPRLRFNFRKVE